MNIKKLDNDGYVNLNPTILGLIAVSLLFVFALVFGFMQMSKVGDLQDNLDQKVASEVQKQSNLISEQKQAEFDEREKAPYKFWTSPTQYGSIKVGFPKTWSYYLELSEVASSRDAINLYAHPDYVPKIAKEEKYALRLTLKTDDYNKVLDAYRKDSEKGTLSIDTVKISNVSGIKVKGLIEQDKSGTLAVFPIRDKVLTIWTESPDFEGDFENIVLKNLSFIP